MMKTYMTRLFTVLMLAMVSMGAWADVKVVYGEKGEEKFTGSGGTIEATDQSKPDANDQVTITLTVAPADGYTISKSNIEVYATISPSGTRGETPEISSKLTLKGKDPSDLSQKRDYTVTVKSTLGLWVKSATFEKKSEGSKGNRSLSTDYGYSGTYYIASDYQTPKTTNRNYDFDNLTNNYYLCPTENWISFDTPGETKDTWTIGDDKPFLTTYKARYHNDYDITKAKWTIEYYTTVSGTDYYYFKHSSGKYLVLNKQINGMEGGSPENRIRVHLETLTSEQLEVEATRNLALFTITQDGRSIYICPKTQSSVHLTVNNGNGDHLQGYGNNKGKITSGSTTYGMEGSIGIYGNSNTDNNKYLYLEDYITRPTIAFNASNKIVITAHSGEASPTIKYTTDGTTPSATNGETYSAPFDPAEGVTTI